MSIKINQQSNPQTIIDAQNKMKANPNINLGTDEIVFPDGSKEKFDYNGEADRQAAIDFAQICLDVCAGDSDKAKRMMASCYLLLKNGYNVDEIVPSAESETNTETYIDYKKGVLLTPYASVVASLTEDELKATKGKKNPLTKSLLLERSRTDCLEDALKYYES